MPGWLAIIKVYSPPCESKHESTLDIIIIIIIIIILVVVVVVVVVAVAAA